MKKMFNIKLSNDFVSFLKITNGISFLEDILSMAKNPILKGAIQDYKDSLEAEQAEMHKIMEYEVTI